MIRMILSNAVYNALKKAALIWVPALGSFYFAIAGIWKLPNPEEVLGTIVAVDTFLGVILGISTMNYKLNAPTNGDLVVDKSTPGKEVYTLELSTPVEDLSGLDFVTLRVVKGKSGIQAA